MLKEYIFKQFPIRTGEEFHYLPKFRESEWEKCAEKERLLSMGKEIAEQAIPVLTATMFLDFFQTGSRGNYETNMTVRRVNLIKLMLAQCANPEENFIPKIADYIWAICEESGWTPPAHNNHYYTHYPDQVNLPRFDADRIYVDLVSGFTGASLAVAYYLFEKELGELSPQINQRLIQRVRDRVVLPVLNYDDFGWMGLAAEGRMNNWNPWIVTNSLLSAMCLPLEPQQKRLFLNKTFLLLEQFLNYYEPDGGCDEGPGYFYAAGGALLECLALIDYVTYGHVNLLDQPLIQNIGLYIERATIFDNYVANFGDNAPRQTDGGKMVYRLGKILKSDRLIQCGLHRWSLEEKETKLPPQFPERMLRFFLMRDEMEQQLPDHYRPEPACFMESIMVLIARQSWDGTGFSIAAKGGQNDESHNHNDVGQVMVYLDKKPVIVDPGNCIYEAKTFSPQRYEIPVMQSGCHNLPTVNGCMQQDGKEFRAVLKGYEDSPEKTVLSVEIGGAYPAQAGIETLCRTTVLDRVQERVTIQDSFSVSKGEIVWNLMMVGQPQIDGNRIKTPCGCVITAEGVTVEISARYAEEFDKMTQNNWNGQLYHVTLTAAPVDKGTLTLLFERGC